MRGLHPVLAAGAVAMAALLGGTTAGAQSLANAQLRADFGPRGLVGITDVGTGRTYRFSADGFAITIDGRTFNSDSSPAPSRRSERGRIVYRYDVGEFTLDVTYELRPGWAFLSKQIAVTSARTVAYSVGDVAVLREALAEAPVGFYAPPSARRSLQTGDYGAALRFRDGHGLLAVVQNPFLRVARDGGAFAIRYAPDMDWRPSYGPFESDRGLIAPVRLTGRVLPAAMLPEWRSAAQTDTVPGMDEAEVAAFTDMVRAFLLSAPQAPVNVFVGWCANDYQIDVGTAAGRAEYKRLFDQAAALGARYVLYAPSNSALSRREESVDDWSWEHVLWLGLGQRIRKGEWDAKRDAIPPSVREMIGYAGQRGLRLLAYVYPVLPFSGNPAWLVPSRSDPKRQMATLANRDLQDWLIGELVAFHDRTGIAGYSFDHTFLTFEGSSRYAQWWGWRRVMEELRRRIPGIVIDGRQQYHLYGPWSWLAGSYPHPTFNDEQPESFAPYPDLHFDRVSADRERYTAYRYRNYEFAPSEIVPGFITHQTSRSADDGEMPARTTGDRGVVLTSFRARDWDYLGWRYSLLSSIAVAGWNNVINMIPARDTSEWRNFSAADGAWFRDWLRWAAENKEILRHTRSILGQPALGRVDGTAAIDSNHGFIFLFNPDARRLSARFKLDRTIGLAAAGSFELRELYPLKGRRIGKPGEGFWRTGDEVSIDMDGASALVLELSPAPAVRGALLFNATGTASLANGVLELRDVRGEMGTTGNLEVVVPTGRTVTRARTNGRDIPIVRERNTVRVDVRYAGAAFRHMQPAFEPEASFAGGRVTGTFTIPRRVFAQLSARRRAWPIPWKPEDSLTTWLVPERLLLFAQFAEPDARWEARLSVDGRPVELRKAYTAVRAVPSTFVGFYADLSRLEPDRAHQFELELPAMEPGRFRGLFFENIEPEYTTTLLPAR